MKIIISLLFIIISNYTFAISPLYSLTASGGVYDFIVEDEIIYVATDAGIIDIFNYKTKKKIDKIIIPKIKDFSGDYIAPKIFSIDKIKGKDGIVFTVQGDAGYRDIYYFKDKKLSKILSQEDKLMAKRASFITENLILIGLLSNELLLYDIKLHKQVYREQLSTSVFSDFTTDYTRKLAITCEESGSIRLLNSKTGQLIHVFSGQNLDNIYKVCYNKMTFVGAGQDRRVSVYKWGKESYYMKADFLVYSVGLDREGRLCAYPANENNDIYVFNTNTKQILYKLIGQKSTLTKIEFLPNNKMVSSSEDNNILIWKLK